MVKKKKEKNCTPFSPLNILIISKSKKLSVRKIKKHFKYTKPFQ